MREPDLRRGRPEPREHLTQLFPQIVAPQTQRLGHQIRVAREHDAAFRPPARGDVLIAQSAHRLGVEAQKAQPASQARQIFVREKAYHDRERGPAWASGQGPRNIF